MVYAEEVGFTLLDTNREKEIGLGPDYPYDPLGPGECIIPSALETKKFGEEAEYFKVGDEISIQVRLTDLT